MYIDYNEKSKNSHFYLINILPRPFRFESLLLYSDSAISSGSSVFHL